LTADGIGIGVTAAGVDGIARVAVSVTRGVPEGAGVAEKASLMELGTATLALLGVPGVGVETGTSEAGTLEKSDAGVGDAMDETPVPEPEEGTIPEGVGIGDSLTPDGVMPDGVGTGDSLTPDEIAPEGVGVSVSLGIGGVIPTLAVSDGVGTRPEGVGRTFDAEIPEGVARTSDAEIPDGVARISDAEIPEGVGRISDAEIPVGVGRISDADGTIPDGVGSTPEESSDKRLDTMLLTGIGMAPVGVGSSDSKLDTMLGTAETGTSGSTEDKRLEMSPTSEDTRGGKTPDSVGAGVGVIGTVGPAVPEGRIVGTSEMMEDRIEGKSTMLEGDADSDVGIRPELNCGLTGVGVGAPVPRAVVIPTTIPPDDGWTTTEESPDWETGVGVGWSTLIGRSPVEPTTGSRMDESKLSTGP
jgi:hypothetical protein